MRTLVRGLWNVGKAFINFCIAYHEQEGGNFPKCPFCKDPRRQYVMGRQALVSSRIRRDTVRCMVVCMNCGMQFTATRDPAFKKWSFRVPF